MPYSPWLWKGKPFTPLTTAQRKNGGRGGTGRIVRYHIGGGHKRRLRKLDFKRLEEGPQDVVRIEYDPGRSCHIALLRNRTGLGADGGWSYIVAPDGTRAGDVITSYRSGVPRGLVPQWDSEVARSDVAAGAREVAELQIKARRSKYLADGFRALEAGLDQPLRLDDVPAAAAARGDVHDEGSFAAADAVEEPVLPAAADDDAPDVVQVRTRSNSTSSAPASHRSFSTASPAAPSSSSARAFSSTPAARSIEVSATDAPAKAPSIYPAKVAPRWSQATAGIAPSFALNLLRTLIIKPGNVVQLTLIPLNTPIHCISLGHDTHAALCRGAGTSAVIVGHQKPDEKGAVYSLVRLQSGEVRKIASDSFATIGQVSKCVGHPGPAFLPSPPSLLTFAGFASPIPSRTQQISRPAQPRKGRPLAQPRPAPDGPWSGHERVRPVPAPLTRASPVLQRRLTRPPSPTRPQPPTASSTRTEEAAERQSRTSTRARASAGSRAACARASPASTATRTETRCASLPPPSALYSCLATRAWTSADTRRVARRPRPRVVKERPRGKAMPATMERKK